MSDKRILEIIENQDKYYILGFIKGLKANINELQQENKQLKLINKEYERLNKDNGKGFKITSVEEYNINELLKYKNNWNELKKWLEENWQQSQDIWFVKILNKIQELEKGKSE